MDLKKKIQQDLKQAIKDKNEPAVLILRILLDGIIKKEIEKRANFSQDISEQEREEKSQITDEEVQQTVSTLLKRAKESIEQFKKGERKDLAKKEEKEMDILKKYLPEQLSREKIREIIEKIIQETAASGAQDIGKVMAKAMPLLKGKAGGALVNQIAREILAS